MSTGPGPTAPVADVDPTAASTLALTGVTVVVAIGMGRLFSSTLYFWPVVCAAMAGHAVSWLGRRRGWRVTAVAPAAAAAWWLLVGWLVLPTTTVYALPLGRTLHVALTALGDSYRDFSHVVAPAPPAHGFVIAAMAAVTTAAVLADWSAFRMRSVFEATLPTFTVFVFAGVLGAPRYRTVAIVGYVAAVLVFLLLHHATLATETMTWFASRAGGGTSALVQGGASLGAAAIGAAVLLAPIIPGSHSDPILSYRTGGGGAGTAPRTTISPLVDIRGRLVDQSNVEAFTVQSTRPEYWRLTSLDTFNGTFWLQDFSYGAARRSLPTDLGPTVQTNHVDQDFAIETLSSIWLPVAFRAQHVEGIGGVQFDDDSGSLITDNPTTDGATYHVQSVVPHLTRTGLEQAPPPLSSKDTERYLRLPALSPRIVALARRIVADARATTPYEQALALQNFFQQNFVYDLHVRVTGTGSHHDERTLERFLFEVRRGYCEQFAGAYGIMARAVGLPTRVAVGFTQGVLEPDGLYHVKGLHAHAWPEVYIQGVGWTYFEPTPGRGAPDTSQYTGVPEQQAAEGGNPNVATTEVPTTVPTASTPPRPTTTERPQQSTSTTAPHRAGRPVTSYPLARLLLALLVAGLVWAGTVPALARLRRGRRRAAATDAGQRTLVAWTEACEAMDGAGAPRRPAETLTEYAGRAPAVAGLAAASPAVDALRQLARDVAVVSYAAVPVSGQVASRSIAGAALVEQAVRETLPARARLLRALDPRPLLPHRARRLVVTARAVASRRRQAA